MKQLSLKEIQDKYASGGVSVSSAILRGLQRDPRAGARRLYKVLAKRYEEQKKERNRLDAMLHFERLLWKAGIQHIAGVDEVGMGPLAGPVVAASDVFRSEEGTESSGCHAALRTAVVEGRHPTHRWRRRSWYGTARWPGRCR